MVGLGKNLRKKMFCQANLTIYLYLLLILQKLPVKGKSEIIGESKELLLLISEGKRDWGEEVEGWARTSNVGVIHELPLH